jgi:hypothetical protein
MTAGARRIALLLGGVALLALAACGKMGAPSPPGPPDKIFYPHLYPSE